MKRRVFPALCVLLITSAAFAIKITLFMDTGTFAERAKEIVIAACDRPTPEKGLRRRTTSRQRDRSKCLKGQLARWCHEDRDDLPDAGREGLPSLQLRRFG